MPSPPLRAGFAVTGRVVVTVSRGRVVWAGGRLDVEPGTGRFIPMAPFGPLFEGLAKGDAAALQRDWPYWQGGHAPQAGRPAATCTAPGPGHS